MDRRIAGELAIASFVLIIAGALISPPLWEASETTASGIDVTSYMQDHRGRILASLFVYGLGIMLFLCFAAALWTWLRRVEPEARLLSNTFAFGAVALTVLIVVGFVPIAVGAYRPQEPELAVALRDLTFGFLALSGLPTAVCLGAYAGIVWWRRPLPAWTAWLALVGAIAHVVISASFLWRSGFFSLEGEVIVFIPGTFFAWILAVGTVLVFSGRREAPAQPLR
jgi:hypothetical protein